MIEKNVKILIRYLDIGIKSWKIVFTLPIYVSSRSYALSKGGMRVAAFLKELVGTFTNKLSSTGINDEA